MVIGLLPNPDKDPGLKKTKQITSLIESHGGEVICGNVRENDLSDSDIIMCLGGDGTFLTAIQKTYTHHKPIVGVNLGSLGFLAEISPDKLEEAIEKILNKDFTTEKRMMIQVNCCDEKGKQKGKSIALNDTVISRSGISRILDFDLLIDYTLIERYPGDGIIISTPTGSTAYSLSAGGPIIQPDLELILINPLNPHTLHNRCYIAGNDSRVSVVMKDSSGDALLTADGKKICALDRGDTINIIKSEYHMHLIRLDPEDFYKSISSKIYMRGR